MKAGKPNNVVSIGATLDQPADAPILAQAGDRAPVSKRDEDDGWDRPQLPTDCPVRPLGMQKQIGWFLDVQGQLIPLGPREYSKTGIELLFAPKVELPELYWPQWTAPKVDKKTGEVLEASRRKGFDQSLAAKTLIAACGEQGIFDPMGRVRGRGAHEGKGRALILHTGDKVMVSQTRVNGDPKAAIWHDLGVIEGFVYPADTPSPRPAPDPADDTAGELLLALLQTWQWRRPMLDPMLALGFVGQAYVCGALGWRAHLFITGGRGTGKSTLNGKDGVFDQLLGKGALRTGNASEAAVRQMLGPKTIPVIFDEFEASEFNGSKTKAIIELARVASSGAEMHRGGQDHKAHEFVLKSAFQFSSILMPEMQPQDRSRFAILELDPFPAAAAELDLDAHMLPTRGRQLLRRMIDGWPRYQETLRLYRAALGAGGHSARGQDQFGTLLACADLLLYDHLPRPTVIAHWAALCAPDRLAELINSDEEHDACITHLATYAVQARGGDERETIAAWIARAEADIAGDASVRERLQTLGLKLVNLRTTASGEIGATNYMRGQPGYLAVANGHLGLAAIFRDSRWQRGGYAQALGRAPGAVAGIKVKFAGRSLRAVCVPIGEVIDLPTGAGGVA